MWTKLFCALQANGSDDCCVAATVRCAGKLAADSARTQREMNYISYNIYNFIYAENGVAHRVHRAKRVISLNANATVVDVVVVGVGVGSFVQPSLLSLSREVFAHKDTQRAATPVHMQHATHTRRARYKCGSRYRRRAHRRYFEHINCASMLARLCAQSTRAPTPLTPYTHAQRPPAARTCCTHTHTYNAHTRTHQQQQQPPFARVFANCAL